MPGDMKKKPPHFDKTEEYFTSPRSTETEKSEEDDDPTPMYSVLAPSDDRSAAQRMLEVFKSERPGRKIGNPRRTHNALTRLFRRKVKRAKNKGNHNANI